MKRKFNLIIITIISTLFLFNSCKDEDFGEVGEPFNKAEYIQGTWTCSQVLQLDEYAIQKESFKSPAVSSLKQEP